MAEAKYNAIRIATQLCYSETTINKIKKRNHTDFAHSKRGGTVKCRKQLCTVLTTEQRL